MVSCIKNLTSTTQSKVYYVRIRKRCNECCKMCISFSQHKGLFFHLCQSIWQHIQSNGLQSKYSNDSDFALNLRKLAALDYIPEKLSAFKTLLEFRFYQQEMLSNLIDYFEDTWIGRLNRRTSRAPLFSIKIWNCYSMLENDIPTTNNSVEGWHNFFYSMLSALHPSIWTFITALKKRRKFKSF